MRILSIIQRNQTKIQVLLKRRKRCKVLAMSFKRKSLYYLRLAATLTAPTKKRRVWSVVSMFNYFFNWFSLRFFFFNLKVERSTYWEEEVPKFTAEKFKNVFRVDRKTFDYIVTKLFYLQKEDTWWRLAIPLKKRIAIALYALGSSAEYRTVASLFGVGRSTVGEIVLEVCDAVARSFHEETFTSYPPTNEKIQEITNGFQKLGFPQCYGAIDGCHIEVNVPKAEAVDYYNFKGWHSVVLFAAVDYRWVYLFTWLKGHLA